MGSFFSNVLNFVGLGSGEGSGGRRDAFADFERFSGNIEGAIRRRQQEIQKEGPNPFSAGLTEPFENFDRGALDRYGASAGEFRGRVGGLLRGSALASSRGARIAGTQAAQSAAGARGGLAFGGGAGALAGRFATDAAVGQNAALSNALLQSEQFGIGLERDFANTSVNFDLGLADRLTNARSTQASLEEQLRSRQDSLRFADINSRASLAGIALGGGLQGANAAQQRKVGVFGPIIQQGVQQGLSGIGKI